MENKWTNPSRVALVLSLVYFFPSVIYIVVSSQMTAVVAVTAEQAVFVETVKGLLFVSISTALIFGATWRGFSVINARQRHAQELREALLQSERRATAGLLAATVAHDARNEIAVLKSNNQFMQRHYPGDEALTDVLSDQAAALERLLALTARFTDFENHKSAPPEEVDLYEVTREVLHTLRGDSRLQSSSLVFEPAGGSLSVHTHAILIHQILINLLFNAADASGGGTIEVRIYKEFEQVILEVHDSGPGVPKAQRAQIFDAFYTTKEEGTGLGLVSVRACAKAHGGDVKVSDSHLGGACLQVRLGGAGFQGLRGNIGLGESQLAATVV